MALPEGILTGTVTFGQAVSLIGGRATSMTFTIKPTHDLVHVDSGLQILDFTETITVEEGMPGSITLPYTDQPGFRNAAGEAFTNWAYQVTGVFRGPGGQSKSFTKNFQLPMGQSVVDFDLIPGGSISLPVTAPVARVTSVAGKTGAITVDDLVDAGLGGGGTVPDEGITEAKLAPDAVTQAKIAPAAVGNAELDSEAVTASKIAADAVTGVKVASGAIAKSKLASALQSEIDGKLTKTAADGVYATLEAAAGLSEVVDTKLTQSQVDARVQAVGDQNYAPLAGVPVDYTYDATTGSIKTITEHYPAGDRVTTYSNYNSFGDPVTETDPDGQVWTLTYDTAGNLVNRTKGAPDTTAPSVPTGLASSAITSTGFTVTWSASTDAVGVTGYEVFVGGVSYATPTGTSVTVTGRQASTAHQVTVRARDAAGNWSALSSALTVTTAAPPGDTTPPSAPSGLTVTPAHGKNTLSWPASTDDVGVTGYRVYRGGTLLASPTGTSYEDAAVTNGTAYSYQVAARDAAGNESAKTAAVSGTPPLWSDADVLTTGSLILMEPANPTTAWPAGVPANGATVPNLAASQAAALVGAAVPIAFSNTFAAGEGTLERSAKGGLHIVPSRTADVMNHVVSFALNAAARAYLDSHASDDLYISAWGKWTRDADPSYTTESQWSVIIRDGNASPRAALGQYPPSAALTAQPPNGNSRRLGVRATSGTAGFSQSIGSDSGLGSATEAAFVQIGPVNSAMVRKAASLLLYRVYIENLTASGRTYAQVDAIDLAYYQQETATGGRYAGDTYTAPATLVA